jgi:hypothetical protein
VVDQRLTITITITKLVVVVERKMKNNLYTQIQNFYFS